MQRSIRGVLSAAAAVALLTGAAGQAAAQEVNIYSARHYQTDEALYEGFTEKTGIRINRIEGEGDALMERIKAEGKNSPADVLITVDAGRLWRADQLDLFQPVRSKLLEERIPANLRHPDGRWFGFSTRARVIFYNKDMVDPSEIGSYEDLADPKWKGMVCMRSSSNIYNLSLMASLIEHNGEEKALEWAKGVVGNFARNPQGGDTDQLRAVATGECGLTLANTYYFVRLMQSDDPKDQEVVEKVGVIFPNQDGRGTHVNVSGAGVLKHAPNKDAAVKFLEYLASDEAQRYFAHGNNEYPAVPGVAASDALELLGDFKVDEINVAVYGENQPLAQKLFDRAGWQ
jgi:iron(III) transport system substrate-binding protein